MPALSPEILVIEPFETIRHAMVVDLRAMGHSARGISPADAPVSAYQNLGADIVVLCLAGEDCLSLARSIRASVPDTGIIMLTAGAGQHDKVGGYDSGADIYLTKPVSSEELSAAIHSLARRVCTAMARAVVGMPLMLNSATLQLKGPAATVDVSDLECCLLSAFAVAPEQRMQIERLFEASRRNSVEPNKSALEVQIVRLRKKLEQAGASLPSIKAIRGTGYQLCVPIAVTKFLPNARHD